MKKIFLFVLAIALVNTGYCQIQLTLDEAISMALKNKPALDKARLDGEIAKQQLSETVRKYAPEITGELTMQYNPIIPTSIIPLGQFNTQNPTNETRAIQFGQTWSNTAGIRGKQVLFSPALRNEVKERKLELNKAKLSSTTETENIIYEVSKAYYGVLLAEEELNFSISDTARAHELFEIAAQRYREKQIKELEKKQAEYTLASARNQFFNIQSNLKNARLKLLFNIGLPQNSYIETTTSLTALPVKRFVDVDSTLLQQQSEYRKAALENQIYKQQIDTEKAKLIPQISLNAFLGANQFTPKFNLTESNSWFGNSFVNLSASLPLSSFYIQSKKIQQAQSRYRQSELELDEIVQKFNYETKVTGNNLATSLLNYQNQQASLALAKEIYEDVVNRFKSGLVLSSDVQIASADIQEAQYRTTKALYEVLVYQLELDRLTGFNGHK